jgi:GH15 family glucan-1,4-alpha-glucosidase
MSSLYERSLEIIREAQAPTGAYVASPTFPTYNYCWLRDGSFIAHAMDKAGQHASAEAFFRWVGRTIQKHSHKLDNIYRKVSLGESIGKDEFLHTRFTLDGEEVTEDHTWGNFQIDGYGTWLWALAEHVRLSRNAQLPEELLGPIQDTIRYLELVWQIPTYDCWEEHPDFLHPYSLATVYSGFIETASLLQGRPVMDNLNVGNGLAKQVKEFILNFGVTQGRLNKHIQLQSAYDTPMTSAGSGVDSSLIGVSVPYQVLHPDDPIMQATIQAIEADLHRPGGGVYRYKTDIYYGGGEWVLLTAWLGWYYASLGKLDQAVALCKWIESQADLDGRLPEQVNDHLLAADYYLPWLQKWGPVAKPLTWSHAMYVILFHAIQEGR